ncbi:MAG: signal recognition particle-docking protein FtsY [Spirochaetia bacterium]|uniref:signal recognition particle-docking protein FtsY n=1 Tax=uncultured Treponema sp. TaxID=162155 RepID=UPI0015C18775|nr:signal recognition particle-docking protein FtsY [uncultured Treponema sp.]MDD5789597.1 signal recognition particle-docking protein FtsY [Spirochaetia bacterium]
MAKITFAQKLRNLFSSAKIDGDFFEELTDLLVEGDVGAKLAFELTEELEDFCRKNKVFEQEKIIEELERMLCGFVNQADFDIDDSRTNVFMLLGVNGVGKTTTAAKLARYFKEGGKKVILAAADTFRAAAEEQLEMHGQKLGVRVVSHNHGTDPSAVVFDAAEAARASGGALVLADTAGRLHNKENLVRELQKIDRIACQKADEGCCRKILVIDGTTGQNAVRQAEVFNEAVGVDALVITKCDSTAKGGMVYAIGKELNIPVWFVCTGEKYSDLKPFDKIAYTREFLGR